MSFNVTFEYFVLIIVLSRLCTVILFIILFLSILSSLSCSHHSCLFSSLLFSSLLISSFLFSHHISSLYLLNSIFPCFLANRFVYSSFYIRSLFQISVHHLTLDTPFNSPPSHLHVSPR